MITEAILYIGLAQSLFAAFTLATKEKVGISDRLLIACLLAIAIKFLALVLYQAHRQFFDIDFSAAIIPLTFGPFLYLYTVYLVENRNKFNPLHLLHFLPFLIATAAYFVFFQGEISFDDINYFKEDDMLWARLLYGLLFFSSVLIYTVLTFVKLRSFRKQIAEEFSYFSRPLRLYWVNFIALLFCLIFLTYFVVGGWNALTFEQNFDLTVLSHFSLTILAYCISYFGLRQPLLFKPEQLIDQRLKADASTDTSVTSTGRFSDEEASRLINKLEKIMEEEKPYLNPELTLAELSTRLDIQKHELTDLLNHYIEKNFFSFVNEYRLRSVIKKLGNEDYDHLTLMSIAYDSGFNSKSTFNSLFKQFTGTTPSQFRKLQKSENQHVESPDN
jgi:AraC-like DNA-binding protein